MLALTTCTGSFCAAMRFCSSATQPLPRAMPYSADRLSPTTSSVRLVPCACTGVASTARGSRASRLQCATKARRAISEASMSEPIIVVQRVTKQVAIPPDR